MLRPSKQITNPSALEKRYVFQKFVAVILVVQCLCAASNLAVQVKVKPASQATVTNEKSTPAQLKQDLQSLRDFIDAPHPDNSFSASPLQLEQTYTEITNNLTKPMTANEFWHQTARLNPMFNDAHWSVNLPEADTDMQQLIKKTDGVFPLEVHMRPDGELTLLALAGGGETAWRGSHH